MKRTGKRNTIISILSVMIIIIMLGYDSMGQNSVSIGTEDVNEDAVLQLVSPGHDQGFLVPRMNTAQRLAMNPQEDDNGLLVYDYEQSQFFYWHDGEWYFLANNVTLSLTGTGATTVTGAYPDLVIHSNPNDTSATNEIQDLQLNSNILSITNNTSATNIDLSGYLDNIDDQQISFDSVTSTLSLEDGGNVDLSPLIDNTDEQNLYFDPMEDSLTIDNGLGVDLSNLVDDADADTTNEIITNGELVNSELQIAEGEDTVKVDLSALIGWDLTGNAGTNPAINFIGTTDNNNLIFRTNNTERLRIRGDNGYVGIGTGTDPTERLHVNGNIRIGNGGYIDDDATAGGNNDDWIRLNGHIEMKTGSDNYGIRLRERDTDEFLGITQNGGYSFFADNTLPGNYFLRGNGGDVDIREDLTVGRYISSGNDITSGDQFLYANTQTRYMMYSAAALVAEGTISLGGNGLYAYDIDGMALISLNLPDDSQITQLQVRVYDDDAGIVDNNIYAGLYLTSNSDDVTTFFAAPAISTSGAPGYTTLTFNLGGYNVVNQNYAYYIWLDFEESSSEHRFRWARITYTVTSAD